MLNPKTTNKDSEYVILIVLQRQLWLQEIASMLPLYLTLPVLLLLLFDFHKELS
jgi:hypothetical protein